MCLRHYIKLIWRRQKSPPSFTLFSFRQNLNQMASRLTVTTSFPRAFFQILQFSRRRPSFSAHRAAPTTQTDLIFPAFSSRFVHFAVQFCFRCKFSFTRNDARVRFDSGAIFLDQSQFFATYSNQWNNFILKRSNITSNGFFFLQRRGKRLAYALCWNILK